jgi:anaerobic magnesium-protoporphyrin IX monomethyl ester cyclase
LVREQGFKEIHFVDDNCSVSRHRMLELCDEITRRRIEVKIATPSGIAINTLDEEVLVRMKGAGFYRLCFGIETGDSTSQRLIDKRVDLEKARSVIALANRLGFWTSATFIIGHPHEGWKEIRATIEFAKQTHLDFAVFAILIPQIGTRAFRQMKTNALVDFDESWADPARTDWHRIALVYAHGARTDQFTNQDLQQIRTVAYREFILHKVRSPQTYLNLLRKVKTSEDLLYLLRMTIIPAVMLKDSFLGRFMTYLPVRRQPA